MDFFSLALGLLKLANWAAKQIERAQLRAEGRREVLAEQLAEITKSTGAADELRARLEKLPRSEIDSILTGGS